MNSFEKAWNSFLFVLPMTTIASYKDRRWVFVLMLEKPHQLLPRRLEKSPYFSELLAIDNYPNMSMGWHKDGGKYVSLKVTSPRSHGGTAHGIYEQGRQRGCLNHTGRVPYRPSWISRTGRTDKYVATGSLSKRMATIGEFFESVALVMSFYYDVREVLDDLSYLDPSWKIPAVFSLDCFGLTRKYMTGMDKKVRRAGKRKLGCA